MRLRSPRCLCITVPVVLFRDLLQRLFAGLLLLRIEFLLEVAGRALVCACLHWAVSFAPCSVDAAQCVLRDPKPSRSGAECQVSHLNFVAPDRVPCWHRAFTCTPASTPSFSHPLLSSSSYAPLQQPQPHSEDRSPHCSPLVFVVVHRLYASAHSPSHPLEPRLSSLLLARSPASAQGRRSRPWTACRTDCPWVSRGLELRVGGEVECGGMTEAERRRLALRCGGGVAVRRVPGICQGPGYSAEAQCGFA